MTDDRIDRALTRHFARETANDDAAAAYLVTRLTTALPAQKTPTRWPQILLDWQFAPAWPRLAMLAGCAAIGFIVGSASIGQIDGVRAPAGNDLVSIAFEPEALTGARP